MAEIRTLPWHEEGGKLHLAERIFADFGHHLTCSSCSPQASSRGLPSGPIFSRDQGGRSPPGTKRRTWRCRGCRRSVSVTAFLELCFAQLRSDQLERCLNDVLSDLDIYEPRYRDLRLYLQLSQKDKVAVATEGPLSMLITAPNAITAASASMPSSARHTSQVSKECGEKRGKHGPPSEPGVSSVLKRKRNRPPEAVSNYDHKEANAHASRNPRIPCNQEGTTRSHEDQLTASTLQSRSAQLAAAASLPKTAKFRAGQDVTRVSGPRERESGRGDTITILGDNPHPLRPIKVSGTSNSGDSCPLQLLSVGYINVQGLSSDKWRACCRLIDGNCDLLFIAETWFVDHDSRVRDARFIASTTTAHRVSNATRYGGGMYLVGKLWAKEQVLASWSLEATPFSISFSVGAAQLSGVYFPPFSLPESKVEYYLTDRLRHSDVVLGDFNVRAQAFAERKGGTGLPGRVDTVSRWLKRDGSILHVQPHHDESPASLEKHRLDCCFARRDMLPHIRLGVFEPSSLGIRTDHRHALQLHILPSPAGNYGAGYRTTITAVC